MVLTFYNVPLIWGAIWLVPLTWGVYGEDVSISTVPMNIIFNATDGPYYNQITDGEGLWVGEMWQEYITDASGERIGLDQGFAFNFGNNVGNVSNNVMFIGEDVIYSSGNVILNASGIFQPYQGGTIEFVVIQTDPEFIAVANFSTPPPVSEEDTHSNDTMKLRVTSEGGYYMPLVSDGEQVGENYINPVTMPESNPNQVVGVNEGYSFNFPLDDFSTEVLGYSKLPQAPLGNRHFYLDGDGGGMMVVINDQVVYGTGGLRKYVGATLDETVISPDPDYVSDIILTVPSPVESGGEGYVSVDEYDFQLREGEGSFSVPLLLGDNSSRVGVRYQDHVYDPSNVRIGTNQGYSFQFPVSEFVPPSYEFLGVRKLYLLGGTLDVLNLLIVGASGNYSSYVGGTFSETIVSSDPFLSNVKLIKPTVRSQGGEVGGSDEGEIANVNDAGNGDTTVDGSTYPNPPSNPTASSGYHLLSCHVVFVTAVVFGGLLWS